MKLHRIPSADYLLASAFMFCPLLALIPFMSTVENPKRPRVSPLECTLLAAIVAAAFCAIIVFTLPDAKNTLVSTTGVTFQEGAL